MFRVILLFLFLVLIWGAIWCVLTVTVLVPALGESATGGLGMILGMLVGWGLMAFSLDVGQSRRWIKW